ncbi:MAG: hypothetical protein M1840_006569 [Geoglossum simile]|nr:MAG: hypothetical protein M1840_006569 [Geoglossum simile]
MAASLIACNRSLHMNLPGPKDSSAKTFLRRLMYCVIAAIGPEVAVLWAANDCVAAWWHSMDMQLQGHDYWTVTHSFLAQMGGMVAGGSRQRILLEGVVKIDKTHLSRLSLKEIRDKSKSSSIVKTVACFQVGWLIIQCTGRRIQGLPITPLEVAAVAYAANCFLLYGLWWKKPLDIEVPFEITCEVETTKKRAGEFSNPIFVPSYPFHEFKKRVQETRFGALKARTLDPGGDTFMASAVLTGISTMVFGVIHLAAWNSDFASPIEKTLWRVCGSLATGLPLIMLVAVYLQSLALVVSLMILYVACRTYLMVEPFVDLRSLPIRSYDTVEWASYIPHI